MQKAIIIFIGILSIQFLYGCKASKEIYYSYKVDSYAVDTTKRILSTNSIISYGEYLFEFKIKINLNNELDLESGSLISSSVDYDTTGVYLLGDKNKLYYEFDTFAIKSKIVKTGKQSDKEFGVRLTPSAGSSDTMVFYGPPTEVTINDIKCFHSAVLSKNKDLDDTIELKVLLIKNSNLNSLYKIRGAKFTDEEYCVVGVNAFSPKWNQGYIEEIDAIRPLTEKEKSICESMLIKSKAAVIDTIRGVALKEKKP